MVVGMQWWTLQGECEFVPLTATGVRAPPWNLEPLAVSTYESVPSVRRLAKRENTPFFNRRKFSRKVSVLFPCSVLRLSASYSFVFPPCPFSTSPSAPAPSSSPSSSQPLSSPAPSSPRPTEREVEKKKKKRKTKKSKSREKQDAKA